MAPLYAPWLVLSGLAWYGAYHLSLFLVNDVTAAIWATIITYVLAAGLKDSWERNPPTRM